MLERLELIGLLSKSPVRARIALMLYEKPRRSRELESLEGSSPSSVHRVLEELESKGLVVKKRLGQNVVWELTPKAKDLLSTVLGAPRPTRVAGSVLNRVRETARRVAPLLGLVIGLTTIVLSSSRGLASNRPDWLIGGLIIGLPITIYSAVAYSKLHRR